MKFGRLLGLSTNQLRTWERQNLGSMVMCWVEVMEHWLTEGGTHDYPATWEGLYTLLNDSERSVVARDLKRAVDGKYTLM